MGLISAPRLRPSPPPSIVIGKGRNCWRPRRQGRLRRDHSFSGLDKFALNESLAAFEISPVPRRQTLPPPTLFAACEALSCEVEWHHEVDTQLPVSASNSPHLQES